MATVKCPDHINPDKIISVVSNWGKGDLKQIVESANVRLIVSEPSQEDENGKHNSRLERYVLVEIFRNGVGELTPIRVPYIEVAK
jgi:hypothetical protein